MLYGTIEAAPVIGGCFALVEVLRGTIAIFRDGSAVGWV